MHKIQHFFEPTIVALTIHWQPVMGVISGLCASIYYVSMLKVNVVDVKHGGSWKNWITSFFKKKKL
jgi:hypothetical protein